MTNFWQDKTVIVTGGAGFLGQHLVERLRGLGCEPVIPRSHTYDLRRRSEADRLLADVGEKKSPLLGTIAGQIDVVFHLAANVGGIGYNRHYPYQLWFDNTTMGVNLIDAAIRYKVGKFVQVGTVCAYPKHCQPPFSEKNLWWGYPEETNAPYGLAKKNLLVGLQAARAEFGFNGIYLLPTNLYGPGDEFEPVRSHVIPALIRKCLEARDSGAEAVECWGSGQASRDFLYVEDAVEGLLLAAEKYNRDEPLNLGSGDEVKISTLVYLIAQATGFQGQIKWDTSQPDGQPRRGLDTKAAKHALGWTAQIPLAEGLRRTVEWYEAEVKAKAKAKVKVEVG